MFLFMLILSLLGTTFGYLRASPRKLVDNGTHYVVQGVHDTAGLPGSNGLRSQAFSIPLVKLGEQYYLFSNYYQLNFFEAFRFCEDFGLNLMTVETNAERRHILEFMKKQLKIVKNLWTSGQDLGTKGEFVWMSSGKRMNHPDWEKGQPFANEKNHCVQVTKTDGGLKFVNSFCWDTADFLCEMKSCPAACTK